MPGRCSSRYQGTERVAALLGASAGTSPVALADPDLESRGSTDPRRAALPSTIDPCMVLPAAAKSVELEMKIVRYRQLVDRTADEELLRRKRAQIENLSRSSERSTSKAALIASGR